MAGTRPRPPYQLLGVLFLLALGLLAAVYRYGVHQNEAAEADVRGHLLNLAELKAERLVNWRKHRVGEIQSVVSSPGALESFERLTGPQATAAERSRVEAWFSTLLRELPFENLILIDRNGRLAASSGKRFGGDDHLVRLAAQIPSWQEPFISDFHADPGSEAIHLGLNAPLRRSPGANPFGALLSAVDPNIEIYPALQTWVGPGATGETLLVRRDGTDVLYLNPLRYSRGSALHLRLPLARTDLVPAQVVFTGRSSLTGEDYRGVPVIAAARPVAGTNWFLIVKLDRQEVLAPLLRGWLYLGFLALGLILTAAAGVFWLWRRREMGFLRTRIQAEATLRMVLEASPAAILAVDPEDRVTIWNKAAEDLFGWTAAEVIGKPLPSVPPEMMGQYYEVRNQLQQGRIVSGRTVLGLRKDGSRVGMSVSRGLMRDASGRVIGDMAVLYDITAQKHAEEALQSSEALLRAAFHQAAVGMAHVRLDGHFMRVNRRYSEITGYSEAELLERTYQDITHPDDLQTGVEEVQRLIESASEGISSEKRYVRKDGSVVWVRRTISVVRSRTGQPLHLMGIVEDITGQLEAREQLRRSEARLRQVVEHAPEGIAVVRDRKYQYMNPALARLLGDQSGALLGAPVFDRVRPEDRERVNQIRQRFLQGEAAPPGEFHITALDGRPLVVEVSSAPIEYDGQRAALIFFRDITARKREEEERTRLEMQLQHAQRMDSIGRLAGGVSHDFNNLLTIINGYAEMLLAAPNIAEDTRDPLEEIRAAGKRASSLTQQLLAFSRKQIAEPHPLNLNGVVRESERMLRRLIGENIEIVTDLAADLGAVLADRGQMHQVLMNLAVNARDAMPGGGRISIQTRNDSLAPGAPAAHPDAVPGPYVALSVADTGIGMDENTIRQIFEPFFTTKQRTAGTGLGLSTVYGIVKHSGGWIEVSSRVDHGSAFRVCLPRTSAPVEAPPPAHGTSNGAARPETNTETVLVVEDQDQVRRMVLAILRQNGYRLLEAADGTEALSLSERYEEPIHLLVTDVVMPGMNGVELSDRLCRLRPSLKTLFISGYTADVLAPSGVLSPGLAYLPKPFSPAELSRKVREVLGVRITAQILLIDDDPAVCSLLERLLTDSGYQVFVAPDGNAGLRLARDHAIDVVITDLVMPEREGLEIIPILRTLRPEAWIVAISGAFGGQYLPAAKLLGADRTLPKPVDREELLLLLREMLAREKSERPVPALP